MFKSNDKSFFMIRKIVNVMYFILMCAAVVTGIVLMASSVYSYTQSGRTYTYLDWTMFIFGIVTMILGPVLLQLFWLISDAVFNIVFDVKIIRNATCGVEMPKLPAPLFARKNKCKEVGVDVYEKLKMYKNLCDEGVLSAAEYEEIKKDLLNKNAADNQSFSSDIEKVRKLKAYVDEVVLTSEEFATEKSKILKK